MSTRFSNISPHTIPTTFNPQKEQKKCNYTDENHTFEYCQLIKSIMANSIDFEGIDIAEVIKRNRLVVPSDQPEYSWFKNAC